MKTILYFDMDDVLVDFPSGLDLLPDDVRAKYADDGKGKPKAWPSSCRPFLASTVEVGGKLQ